MPNRKRGKQSEVTRRKKRCIAAANARANESPDEREARLSSDAAAKQYVRANESHEEREARLSVNAGAKQYARENESPEEREARLSADVAAKQYVRANESHEEREARLSVNAGAKQYARENESPDSREARLSADAAAKQYARDNESPVEREARLSDDVATRQRAIALEAPQETVARHGADSARMVRARANKKQLWKEKQNSAFSYNPDLEYESDPIVDIGGMAVVCFHCKALKWKGETPGMCCSSGKVKLPLLAEPPEPLLSLLTGDDDEARHFKNNIRKYNSCFQMTSFGCGKMIREPGYMPTFKVQGQVYHRIGSLLPLNEEDPKKFLQIYFVADREHQAEIRTGHIPQTKQNIVLKIQDMLHQENKYVRDIKCAKDKLSPVQKIVIRADKTPAGEHVRRFNAPSASEVACIVSGDIDAKRDIVLEMKDNRLKRISDTHPSYDALQYPLIFWKGDDGYHFELRQNDTRTGSATSKKISAMDFYAFRIMQRVQNFNHILRCRDLFHQFAVDMFVKVESERLRYVRLNQKNLRAENYAQLQDALTKDGTAANIGQLVVLPSSFTGGPRYMHERVQDAMAYVRAYGGADLFVTFTCNRSWEEITRELLLSQKPQDRHDLVARVFHEKLKAMMNLIKKGEIFGEVKCFMYTVEWQKRGLPHAHILLWIKDKIQPDKIDSLISAEIPNEKDDPKLYRIVTKQMVHGPCGEINPNSPCMKENDTKCKKCTKGFPKQYSKETHTEANGYPLYRRRSPENGGFTATVEVYGREVKIDNRWCVPYCPLLSRIFNAHINVEYCSSVKCIKYVCKYINKGSDMAVFGVNDNVNDEILSYELGRYVSTNEAIWRLLGFSIHERYPPVTHLCVHLENGQRVYFNEQNVEQQMEAADKTTLTAFFKLCQDDEFARMLYYNELPKYYTWNKKTWARRKMGKVIEGHPGIRLSEALGRVYTVHPNNFECFYLRLLLHKVKGPTSFQNLKTVKGTICSTYQEACLKQGLLEDDSHWDKTLEEAAVTRSPCMLRNLFAVMLQTCAMANSKELWDKHKENMTEDILHEARFSNPDLNLDYTEAMFNKALIVIEDKVRSLGGTDLNVFGLQNPDRGSLSRPNNEILRETSYDMQELAMYVQENEAKMVKDQQDAFDTITQAVFNGNGNIFFLDSPGGTGKTFLINLILAKVRLSNLIALAVASSGIAATLLTGGKTAHSAFKLPLNLIKTDTPTCNIGKNTDKAKLLQQCKLIVWDECTMSHKSAFEALNRTLKDLRNNKILMGGVTLVLAGDFRQTLPVIPRGTKADQLQACLKNSDIWKNVHRLNLTTNMRVRLTGDTFAGEFSDKLLRLGNGMIQPDEAGLIGMANFVIVKSIKELKECVFPNVVRKFTDHSWLCQRAILAPRNEEVRIANLEILKELPGNVETYKSIDTVPDRDEAVNFPTEFLNSLEMPGVPEYTIRLKVGAPIMLMRNLDPPALCNGTRLAVKKLMPHIIEATIITGPAAGKDIFIPKIPVIPTDTPVEFRRLQFPVCLSFAMTINKAQGQSLKVVGLQLQKPCFSHGQLYVGCSRVSERQNLFILCPGGKTVNIVYPEALKD